MNDWGTPRAQLADELQQAHRRIAELEARVARCETTPAAPAPVSSGKPGQLDDPFTIDETRYRTLIEIAQVGMFRIRTGSSAVLEVNSWLADLMHTSREELLTKSDRDCWVDPAERDALLALLRREKTVSNYEAQLLAVDGCVRTCLVSCALFPDVGVIEGTVIDVTDLRRAELEIERRHEQFLAILDNFPQVLYVADPQTYRVLFVNRVFANLLGKDPVGGLCYQEFQGRDTPCECCTNQIILDRREPYTWVHENTFIGRVYHISDQIISWPDGRDVRLEVAVDISQRRQAEAALAHKAKELERSNQALERFAYIASHDLQEPLRSIRGYLQLLERHHVGQLDDEARFCIQRAVAGAGRMKNLIQALLAFSRVGTSKNPFAPVDLNAVVLQAVENLGQAICESQADIRCDHLPVVPGDGAQLLQLMQNLIGNAIKFRRDEPPRIDISAEQVPPAGDASAVPAWRLAVRDNGLGIDPRHAERVFESFQRLQLSDRYPGAGIGLAICKKIVERHGGKIWLEPATQHGAIFFFTLPGTLPAQDIEHPTPPGQGG